MSAHSKALSKACSLALASTRKLAHSLTRALSLAHTFTRALSLATSRWKYMHRFQAVKDKNEELPFKHSGENVQWIMDIGAVVLKGAVYEVSHPPVKKKEDPVTMLCDVQSEKKLRLR